MVNNLTPICLFSLLPPQVGNIARYNLRNQNKYQTINCKYHLFRKNNIDDELRVCGNREDTNHFLFVCPRFQMQRQIMINILLRICNMSLHVFLLGTIA